MNNDELYKKFRYTTHLMKPRPPRPGVPGAGRPGRPVEDPTRGQGRILAALKLQDNIPTKDLAFILGMRVASLNEHLSKLDAAGLITREPSPGDKRIMLIKLTEDGRKIEQLHPERPNPFEKLSDEQIAQLDEILDRIIEHLESLNEENENLSPSDTDFTSWSERARARMGEDRFEAWLERISDYALEGPGRHFGPRGRWHGGPGHHGHEGHPHHEDREGLGSDHHGHGGGRGRGGFGKGYGRGGYGEGRGGRGWHEHDGEHMKGERGRGNRTDHSLDDSTES